MCRLKSTSSLCKGNDEAQSLNRDLTSIWLLVDLSIAFKNCLRFDIVVASREMRSGVLKRARKAVANMLAIDLDIFEAISKPLIPLLLML